jgi:hypothetical protein
MGIVVQSMQDHPIPFRDKEDMRTKFNIIGDNIDILWQRINDVRVNLPSGGGGVGSVSVSTPTASTPAPVIPPVSDIHPHDTETNLTSGGLAAGEWGFATDKFQIIVNASGSFYKMAGISAENVFEEDNQFEKDVYIKGDLHMRPNQKHYMDWPGV